MLHQQQRNASLPPTTTTTPIPVYEYEYELNSTRGRKRVLNSVAVCNGKLYILNATTKCRGGGGEVGEACDGRVVQVLRDVMATFQLLP